ncbi:uncharacterized protein LOC126183568 [Schistocerca cancellata]|uniref:uncharacterized protein LOC126183568 n=1 Tax=Schistocerca cancellata TaxID=274614 RepID=UPI002119075D|nr:uncharacterized protein LOC126183568 [Schistocerca cancellata]
MAAAPAVLAGAVALLAASASAFNAQGPVMASEFTTSLLFDDLVQPLCTESTTNDACYGCFARYARMRQVPDAYDELKKCARDYLNDTSYAECQAVIGDATGSQSGQSKVFCDFEKCVRKRDMLHLVDECARQSDNSKSEAEKYVQTTSCVLEEMHRRKFLSGPRYPGGFSSPKAYALYVTEAGELRVMSTYVGANDQFSCEPSPSPLGPISASAGGSEKK